MGGQEVLILALLMIPYALGVAILIGVSLSFFGGWSDLFHDIGFTLSIAALWILGTIAATYHWVPPSRQIFNLLIYELFDSFMRIAGR